MYKSKRAKQEAFIQKLKRYLIILGLVAIFFAIVYVFAFSQFSKVQRFIVLGLEANTNPQSFVEKIRPIVKSSLLGRALGDENYFAWTKRINYQDESYLSISVSKRLRDRAIIIQAQPRERFASWCKSAFENEAEYKKCYWLDSSGLAFEKAPILIGQLIFSINEDSASADFSPGERLLPSQNFSYIKSVLDFIKSSELEIREIRLDRELQELQIHTPSGTNIRFSYRFNPETSAIPGLRKILEKEEAYNFSEFNLTVENRAYSTKKYLQPLITENSTSS